MTGFATRPGTEGRAGVLNPQRSGPEQSPDSISLTPKELRPPRIVVHNKNSVRHWLQRSDCVSADMLFGECWAFSKGLGLF
jgi:hypothetical protein